jgi:tetratricopeptide (TPR) repeat protein
MTRVPGLQRLLALWLLAASLAWGAGNSKASALAKEADRLYKENRYRDAAETLKQAYEVDPNTLFLYNIARAWDQAGELSLALESYRQYVAQPSDATTPELVKKANLAMDRLRTLVAKNEADRRIQDAEKKRLEDERTRADARAEAEAKAAREQRQQYEEKERLGRESKTSTLGTRKLVAFISGGVAVASFITSLTFALLANGSRNAFREATTLPDKSSLESTTRTQALVCDVLLVVGLATAATAIALYPKGSEAQPSVSIALGPLWGGGFAALGGRF